MCVYIFKQCPINLFETRLFAHMHKWNKDQHEVMVTHVQSIAIKSWVFNCKTGLRPQPKIQMHLIDSIMCHIKPGKTEKDLKLHYDTKQIPIMNLNNIIFYYLYKDEGMNIFTEWPQSKKRWNRKFRIIIPDGKKVISIFLICIRQFIINFLTLSRLM